MAAPQVPLNQRLVGGLSAGMLVGALVLIGLDPGHGADGLGGMLLRIGVVLGALYLALPRLRLLKRTPTVSMGTVVLFVGALLVLARMRIPLGWLMVTMAAVMLVLLVVRPKSMR